MLVIFKSDPGMCRTGNHTWIVMQNLCQSFFKFSWLKVQLCLFLY